MKALDSLGGFWGRSWLEATDARVVMIMVVGYGGPKVQSFVSATISLLAEPIFFSRHPRHGWVGRSRNRGCRAKESGVLSRGIRGAEERDRTLGPP